MNTTTMTLFDIDEELDELLDLIQEQTDGGVEVEDSVLARFHAFCQAHGEKVDRIGRYIRTMEARESYCRGEATRLNDRAKAAAGRAERTKAMVMFHLMRRNVTKVEGREFTLRVQKNSQTSVRVTSDAELPVSLRRLSLELSGVLYETVLANLPTGLAALVEGAVSDSKADNEAIRAAFSRNETVAGAELRRGSHLRVA